MVKKHNSYDSGYKKLFSNHVLLRQLLTGFVNEEWVHSIEYNTLERIDKSFISDEFTERESDLIYKVKFEKKDLYIYILLEFQSTVDRFMSLRMLHYILELYEYLVKNHRIKTLPAVFPILLYNGEKKWTAPEELSKLIKDSINGIYIPHFRYYKIAENEFEKEFLKNIKSSVSALFYAENCSGDELQNEISSIVDLLKSEKPEEISIFIKWFKYMFNDKQEFVEEIQEINKVKSMLRTSIKNLEKKLLQEGLKEGIEKGIHKGKLEANIETAKALLKEKMSVKKISKVTGLSIAEIEKLK